MKSLAVIYNLIKKDLIILFRYPVWFISSLFIMPMLFILPYIFVGRMFLKMADAAFVDGFILVGSLLWIFMIELLWGISDILRDEQMYGTLESLWVAPVSKFYIMMGSGIRVIISALISILIMLLEVRLFFNLHFYINSFFLLIVILTILSCYGVALVYAGIIILFKEVDAATNIVTTALAILCGIAYPIDILPQTIQFLSKIIPLSWSIKSLRLALLYNWGFKELWKETVLLFSFSFIAICFGYLIFKKLESKSRKEGVLGTY